MSQWRDVMKVLSLLYLKTRATIAYAIGRAGIGWSPPFAGETYSIFQNHEQTNLLSIIHTFLHNNNLYLQTNSAGQKSSIVRLDVSIYFLFSDFPIFIFWQVYGGQNTTTMATSDSSIAIHWCVISRGGSSWH